MEASPQDRHPNLAGICDSAAEHGDPWPSALDERAWHIDAKPGPNCAGSTRTETGTSASHTETGR